MARELDILYQDASIAVVDKPGGLLSVPGRGPDKQDCVTARLRKSFPGCISQPAVHRLDMETSGLMVLALTAEAHRNLSIQFQNRLTEKEYLAILEGVIEAEEGVIRLPFRLDIFNRPCQMYDPIHGKIGITRWQKLSVSNRRTRVRFRPVTGRTHQLRVHAAHRLGLDCPIVGDRLYGHGRPGQPMLLHASYLRFQHPDTGKNHCFESSPAF